MSPDLAALVGSRICHDLISPIGAIGNGVELLSLTEGDTGAEMDLISESVENANARIRYFRIAFGAASDDQMVSRTDVMSILAATARGGRFAYDWQVEAEQPRRLVRAAFLIMQCLETALPLGGEIKIQLDGDNWMLHGDGRRLNVNEALWNSLTVPVSGFSHSAAQVQFALLPGVLAEADRKLRLDIRAERIVARF